MQLKNHCLFGFGAITLSLALASIGCGDDGTGGSGATGASNQGGEAGSPNTGGGGSSNNSGGNNNGGNNNGGNGGAGGNVAVDCSNPTEITAADFAKLQADGTASVFGATPSPDLGAVGTPDNLTLEFYGPNAGDFDGDQTGTFDLSMGGDSNYATCSRCVRVTEDGGGAKVYFQTGGTLVVDATSDQLNGTVHGSLSDVTLVEVTIDPNTYESTPVAGGACLHLAAAPVEFVTLPPPAEWVCDAGFYGDGSFCDCGCGAADPDCADATVGSCDYCDDMGSCSVDACPGTIDPANNAICTAG
ncbi:MAG: hypothetical protein U0271_31505 [Polyangiaceae bacterium]